MGEVGYGPKCHIMWPFTSSFTVDSETLARWGLTIRFQKTAMVQNYCLQKSNELLGVCGHFSASVKLPTSGAGLHLRMSGSYPQAVLEVMDK